MDIYGATVHSVEAQVLELVRLGEFSRRRPPRLSRKLIWEFFCVAFYFGSRSMVCGDLFCVHGVCVNADSGLS
jgi:hypothetical protein